MPAIVTNWDTLDAKKRGELVQLIAKEIWRHSNEDQLTGLDAEERKGRWQDEQKAFLSVARKVAMVLAKKNYLSSEMET